MTPIAAPGTARWRAPDAARLNAAPLDSLTALYDRASGQTHLIGAPIPEILSTLADGVMTARQLTDALAQRFDLAGDGDALAHDALALVEERLAEMAALGLVEAL